MWPRCAGIVKVSLLIHALLTPSSSFFQAYKPRISMVYCIKLMRGIPHKMVYWPPLSSLSLLSPFYTLVHRGQDRGGGYWPFRKAISWRIPCQLMWKWPNHRRYVVSRNFCFSFFRGKGGCGVSQAVGLRKIEVALEKRTLKLVFLGRPPPLPLGAKAREEEYYILFVLFTSGFLKKEKRIMLFLSGSWSFW